MVGKQIELLANWGHKCCSKLLGQHKPSSSVTRAIPGQSGFLSMRIIADADEQVN